MPTFAEIATADADSRFDILVAAAQFVDTELPGTDLIATLSDPTQSLTVFAPTDAAFVQLAQDLGFTGDTADEAAVTTFVAGLGAETVRDVILYHVSGSPLSAADIAAAGSVQPLSGPLIQADLPVLEDAEPDLLNPSVVQADIAADNGILHVIDRVLLPVDFSGNDAPTIAGIVAASGTGFDTNAEDFDILLQAVSTAGLVDTLNATNADLTVFAPNDGAFVALAQALGYGASDEAGAWDFLVDGLTLLGAGNPLPLLGQVLTYHVVGEALQSSQVVADGSVQTLQGGTLTLNGLSLQDAEPDLADPSLIALDIQASNGVVHVIDGVLLPADLLASDGSNDVDFVLGTDAAEVTFLGNDDDFINAKGGDDTAGGGAGDDVVLGGAGNDLLWGGDDDDQVKGDAGNDALSGGTGDDFVDGGDGNDVAGGGFGDDTVAGGAGDDNVFGAAGHDNIWGGLGDDTLAGGDGDDVLSGAAGNDQIFSGDGDDTVYAAAGDDEVHLGLGSNVVFGGSGVDTFVFYSHAGEAEIEDFEDGIDLIDLSAFGLTGFAQIQSGISGGATMTEIEIGTTMITLDGFDVAHVDAADFIF